jgi:hypothetical protein
MKKKKKEKKKKRDRERESQKREPLWPPPPLHRWEKERGDRG